jgi:Predicted Rossmann fold nucleotide-binding protein
MEIFVGCSSSENIDEKYLKVAQELGTLIGKNNHNLIFGSSEYGLMGEVYRSVKKSGGEITAIIPKEYKGFLTDVEADKVITTGTATDQLKELVNTGDITIILPGSFGVISELTTSIHCRKLGEHKKKIFILNTNGFFDDLLKMFDKMYHEKFDGYDRNELFEVVDEPKEIFEIL